MSKQDEKPFRWEFTDHICRICFSRVMKRTTFDGRKIYKCSNCEVERDGVGAQCICCCGIKLRKTIDSGIRCIVNPNRSPENPAVVIAEQISQPK